MSRATSFNKTNVTQFFDNLKGVLTRFKFGPESIYNIDETKVPTVQDTTYVLAKKGAKQVGQITSAERGTTITMCAGVSVTGNLIPPFYIFPRVNFKENLMLRNAAPESSGTANPSGWQTVETFMIFLKHLVKHANPTSDKPILILMDNHDSHVSVKAVDFCKKNGIVLLTIPPHTSNRLQPLDVSLFGPFRGHYNRAIDSWLAANPGKTCSLYEVAELSGKAFSLAFTPKNIQSGFARCGIYPFNRDIFTDDDFIGSYVTDRPKSRD